MEFSCEIARATEWLTSTFLPENSVHASTLAASIKAELEVRYEGHWYPDEAHRGCAYRSLTCNGDLDPVLETAIRRSNIDRKELLHPEPFILWCNPLEVKVTIGGSKWHIYCAGSTPNPYSKPKVIFEPTRLNVRASENSSSSSSSDATSPTSSPVSASPVSSPKSSPERSYKQLPKLSLSPSAPKFVPNASLQFASAPPSDSSSDSDGELDVRSSPTQMPRQAGIPMPHGAAFAPPPPPAGLLVSQWPTAPQIPWPATGWQPFNLYALEAH